MELPPFFLLYVKVLLFFTVSLSHQATSGRIHTNFTDVESLLSFKAQLGDPYGVLAANWTTNTSFCNWVGISCSHRHERVTAIRLLHLPLDGTISSHLGNLSFLSVLFLGNCSLTGPIPQVLGQLPRLKTLNLIYNILSGPVPASIFNMSSLITLSLTYNNLIGPLPSNNSFFSLPRLELISLSFNQLTGEIPSAFAECRALQGFSLSSNEFTGTIPSELGHLTNLSLLYLGTNQLTGTIPNSLGNLTKLTALDLGENLFEGVIPKELGYLPNLEYLNLGPNRLTGAMPDSLLNASTLTFLQLTFNSLTGSIPVRIGESLPSLTRLLINANHFTGGLDFITSLSNCRDLVFLDITRNEFDGVLPHSIGNLSLNLYHFGAAQNNIEGEIPRTLGNLSSLVFLDLSVNKLVGKIPLDIAKLEKLQSMSLGSNKIGGPVPSKLNSMRGLGSLLLEENKLIGPIPDSIGNISRLQHLSLSSNRLSSTIPMNLWNSGNLIELRLSRNSIHGELPPEVRNLKALDVLDLSVNKFSGNIPTVLGHLVMLAHLDFSRNSFQGEIPPSLGSLVNVKYLNLSHNFLSGSISKSIANIPQLGSLDLSFNKLEGQIPEGRVFSNHSIPSLEGNIALCGAPQLNFPPCETNIVTSNSRRKRHLLKYVLPAVAFVVIVLASLSLVLLFYRRRTATKIAHNGFKGVDDYRLVSHHELVRATDNFNEGNLIGKGSFGSVYKGCLDDGLVVAVKVLDLDVEGASNSFESEYQALSKVRHRNLIKIITICLKPDFKALLLQFMPKGNLDEWLYADGCHLSLLQRLNVMVDVSLALEHLHHHHPHPVLHCDLKPSNILLDEEMTAHLGDFGIAKLLLGDRSVVSASMAGTIGYIAPEYGSMGTVSKMGDVYSLGILLLEIITGKKPTDPMFNGESSLREWIREAYPASLLDVVDQSLLKDDLNAEQRSEVSAISKCLSSIVELGLNCSASSPMERIPMTTVVPKLQKIKREYMSLLPSSRRTLPQVQN